MIGKLFVHGHSVRVGLEYYGLSHSKLCPLQEVTFLGEEEENVGEG